MFSNGNSIKVDKSRFHNFLYPNHHNIRPYYQNHVSIFFTGDRCPDTFCPKGWNCTSLDWPVDISCICTSGNCNVSTGKLSSIINLEGLLLEEFSRHINFSEQYLCRGISIAFIIFASFFPIIFLRVYHRGVKERHV